MVTNKPKWKRRVFVCLGAVVVFAAGLMFVSDFFPEQEKEIRTEFRKTIEESFPDQAAKVAESFGLTFYGEDSTESQKIDAAACSVVLIHGLDDPGKVWMNLAPALTARATNVWEMFYPNDQPVVDSAWFFYEEARRLKDLGVNELAIVAHSMGGLVTREMLSNPEIAYMEHARDGAVPRVTALVMVGTPNHGSEFARFRGFGEIREQWVNVTNGRGHILRGVLDGAGEAKLDLLPESEFLKTLNQRPHPEGVDMLIIAGDLSPWDKRDLARFFAAARENASARVRGMLAALEGFLSSMSNGLGDGLVTVESTRLDDIAHRTVSGTHLSMIRNLFEESERVPPAVPFILEYLGEMCSKQ